MAILDQLKYMYKTEIVALQNDGLKTGPNLLATMTGLNDTVFPYILYLFKYRNITSVVNSASGVKIFLRQSISLYIADYNILRPTHK
jgi:hypothetical protein